MIDLLRGHFSLFVSLVVAGLLGGMLLMLEVGRRLGARARGINGEQPGGFGAVEGAIFGLMGLLIAFTFSGAAARFDTRRTLIVEEANNIGTAWLRLDLLPPAVQPAIRETFRQYVDRRIAAYHALPDVDKALAELARANTLQGDIWRQAVAGSRDTPTTTAMLLLPALNNMIDITTTRFMATRAHPPATVWAMLTLLLFMSALLAGYGMAGQPRRSWTHTLAFAVVLSMTVFLIVDLEYPRLGLANLNTFDQVLVDLRATMK